MAIVRCLFVVMVDVGVTVVYMFVLQTKTVCIDTCGSSFDTILGIYEDAGTAAGVLLASNDDFSTCGDQSMIEFVFQAGTSYLVVVVSELGSAVHL